MLGVRGLANASSSGAVTLSTVSGPGQVTINWTHPGSARLLLNLYRNGALIATKAVTDTSHIDTIAQGTYTYTAAYVKNGVVGTFSSGVAGVSAATGPAAPTLTSVTSNASGFQITANWTNAGSFTTRIYSRTGTPGNYSYTLLASAGAGSPSTTATTTSATAYDIIARHFNGSAESVDSNVITLTTNLGSPTSITFTSVTATSYTVGWTNTDTTAPVDVLRGGVSQGIQAVNTTVFAASSLTANTQFSWIVRYTKNGVTGANLTGSQWTRPAVPTSLSVSNTTTPVLVWTNAHSLPVYVYRNGAYIGMQSSTTAGQTSSFTDLLAPSGTVCNYIVRHYNGTSLLESADSNTASITTALQPPTNLVATATTSTTVQVTWTNSGSGLKTFVERSLDGTNFSVVNGVNGTTGTSFDDTGRAEATTYYYRARHYSDALAAFSAYTSTVQATTTLTSTVQNFTHTGTTTSTLSMSWSTPNPGTYQVEVFRAADSQTVSGSNDLRLTAVSTITSFTDTGLTPARTYTFGARYSFNGVRGPFSNFTRGTLPSNLTSFSTSASSPTSVTVSIQKPASEVTSVLVERSVGSASGPWTTVQDIPNSLFSSGFIGITDSGVTASTVYHYRARAAYTALNGGVTFSAAYSTSNLTTPSAGSSITQLGLSRDSTLDRVVVTFSANNVPSGGYVQITYSWVRYTSLNVIREQDNQTVNGISSGYFVDFGGIGIDLLDPGHSEPNPDFIELAVELRMFTSANSFITGTFVTANIGVDAMPPGGT